MNKICTIAIICMFLSACSGKKRESGCEGQENIKLKYAQGFTIGQCNGYEVLTVVNPWKENEVYERYYLVKNPATTVPDDGKKIIIPLNSFVANSATYLEFLNLLGITDKLSGVCNSQYIYNPAVLKRVKDGSTKDLGDAFNLDIENLLVLHSDAIMTSAYNAEDQNSRKLERCGIPVIYNIEWQEKNPLGRAEWIKFIAAFFDKQQLADSIFNKLEASYHAAKEKVKSATNTPIILSGQDFRGTWSMPGGQSFNAQLFKDAGYKYLYADDKETGSISTNIENALIHFNKADIWIGVQANSLEELSLTDSKYKLFEAFKAGNVYNYNKRVNGTGGNDYWEGAVAHPDLLLKDLIKVSHPEILPEYELTFMKKLE